ncbi:MAG TPA: glycosyltransferase family 39 protein [Anaerolineales bacterium]|nr:glycosyltransferase family 39 protein [Anaerolineales bacterium]
MAAVFLERGVFGNNLTGEDRPIAQNSGGAGRLFALGVALFFRWLGISLFSARLFSLLGYLAAIALLYVTGRKLFHPTTGLLAAAFFGLSWIALLHGHSGRPDIWVATGGVLLLLALWRTVVNPGFWSAALTGLAGVLIIDFHLNGVHFLAAASIILALWSLKTRKINLWIPFGLGLGLGALFWIVGHLYVGANTASGLVDVAENVAQIPLATKFLRLLDWWWRQYWVGTRYESLLQGLCFGLGLALLAIRRERGDRILLAYILLSALSFAMIRDVQEDWYRILWMPLVALVTAEGVRLIAGKLHDWRRIDERWRPALPFVLAMPLLSAYLLGDAYLLYKFRDVSYDNVVTQFEAHIPAGSRVAAEATWWYGLGSRHEFLDDILFFEETYRMDTPQLQAGLEATLRKWRFDYVIYDGRIACFSDVTPAAIELKRMLDERCTVAAIVNDKWFGQNVVYHCLYDVPAG